MTTYEKKAVFCRTRRTHGTLVPPISLPSARKVWRSSRPYTIRRITRLLPLPRRRDPSPLDPCLWHPGLPDPGLPDPGLPDPGLPDPGLPDPGLPDPGLR